MNKRWLTPLLAALTIVFCWVAALIVRSNLFPFAQAQSGGKEAGRTTVEISRTPPTKRSS